MWRISIVAERTMRPESGWSERKVLAPRRLRCHCSPAKSGTPDPTTGPIISMKRGTSAHAVHQAMSQTIRAAEQSPSGFLSDNGFVTIAKLKTQGPMRGLNTATILQTDHGENEKQGLVPTASVTFYIRKKQITTG